MEDKKSVCVCNDEEAKIKIIDIANSKKGRVLFKTLITFEPPEELFTLHSIFQYKACDSEIKRKADNLEELKECMFQRMADGYPKQLGAIYNDAYGGYDERKKAERYKHDIVVNQLKAIYWVFGEEYKDEKFSSRLNVDTIVKVWEHKNKRVALFQETECIEVPIGGLFNGKRDVDRVLFKIKSYTPKDKEYDYVDVGREVGLCENHSDYDEIWISDELQGKVVEDFAIIQSIAKKLDFWLLTPDKYAEIQKEIVNLNNNERREEVQRQARNMLQENIQKQFETNKVVRHGITFTKKYFEYEDIKVSGDCMDEYLVRSQVLLAANPDFVRMLKNYITYILEYHNDSWSGKIKMKQGNIFLKIRNIDILVFSSSKGVWINKIRINKDEIEEVIFNAINFKTQKAYDKFLEETSRVSLKLKRVLEKGVFEFDIRLSRSYDYDRGVDKEQKIILAIPVIRENNKNCIVIKDKKFTIKNTTAFFNLGKDKHSYRYDNELDRVITQIYKATNKLTPKDIAELIADGTKRYKKFLKEQAEQEAEKVERSKEFIANAVRITKAVKKGKGWIVKGISGTHYYVDQKCGVYSVNKKTGKTDRYICIVDGGYAVAEWQVNDRIAKRLLMLSKDLKVADEVETLFPEREDLEEDEVEA